MKISEVSEVELKLMQGYLRRIADARLTLSIADIVQCGEEIKFMRDVAKAFGMSWQEERKKLQKDKPPDNSSSKPAGENTLAGLSNVKITRGDTSSKKSSKKGKAK